MSMALKNNDKNQIDDIYNIEETKILREIFNIIEDNNSLKEKNKKNNLLYEKFNIKNIKLNQLTYEINNNNQKNRYKIKLQKIIFRNKISN